MLSSQTVATPMRFRPDIEGLRALAVLIVIAFHGGWHFARGGFIGVDVFFVLSGYLIIGLLLVELEQSDKLQLIRFYARRSRRLMPAFGVVLVTTIVAARILLSPLEQDEILNSALASVFYSGNIYFARYAGDYFGHALASNPFLHMWSLAVEEQFYLVWPFLMLLFYRISKKRNTVALLILLVTVSSFVICIFLTHYATYMAFFLSPARAWEFGLGGLASMVPTLWLQARPRLALASGWVGIGTVLASALLLREDMLFPGWIAILPVMGTVLALFSGVGAPGRGIGVPLNSRLFQFLGGLSYSLYLWHWPVLVLARSQFGALSTPALSGCLLLTLALAYAGHQLIENPIRHHTYLLPRQGLTLALSLVLTLLSATSVLGWRYWVQHNQSFERFSRVVYDVPAIYTHGCQVNRLMSEPKLCTFAPDGPSTQTIVLFGDSHAAQWFPTVAAVARNRHWTVLTMIKASCPPVDVRIYAPALHRENVECHIWYERSLEKIRNLHPGLVILSFATWYPSPSDPKAQLSSETWESGLARSLAALSQEGVPIRLIRDTPRPEFDVPSCLAKFDWDGRGGCSPMLRARDLDTHVFDAELAAAQGLPNVKVVDLTSQFCGPVYCPIEGLQKIFYRDDSHLSNQYAEDIAPALAPYLESSFGGNSKRVDD